MTMTMAMAIELKRFNESTHQRINVSTNKRTPKRLHFLHFCYHFVFYLNNLLYICKPLRKIQIKINLNYNTNECKILQIGKSSTFGNA